MQISQGLPHATCGNFKYIGTLIVGKAAILAAREVALGLQHRNKSLLAGFVSKK